MSISQNDSPAEQPVQSEGQPAFSPEQSATIALERRTLLLLLLGLGALIMLIVVRLFRLEHLQNEVYDDIGFAYDYIRRVREGEWPSDYVLSTGPLYHYLVTPLTWVAGMSYYAFKLASVIVSLLALAAIYLLTRRLLDTGYALLATFIAGVSSWMLIFSRLGNLIITYPLLTALALWMLVRLAQRGRYRDAIACGFFAMLGVYNHPATFFLPIAVGLALLCLWATMPQIRWKQVLAFGLASLIFAIPFVLIVSKNLDTFGGSYFAGKLETRGDTTAIVLDNLKRTLLSFHISGDHNFRSNPPFLPHLDPVSGILMLLGSIFWLTPGYRRLSPVLFVPLLVLLLPSALVLGRPGEIPSASRTFGVSPIIYILVASGVALLLRAIRSLPSPRMRLWNTTLLCAALLSAIFSLNMRRYFRDYISTLPLNNTPVGRLIANHIESLPKDTTIYVFGCCWASGMPEGVGILLALEVEDARRVEMILPTQLTCEDLEAMTHPATLIWDFNEEIPSRQLAPCLTWLPPQTYTSATGQPIFKAAPLIRAYPDPQELAGVKLVDATVLLEGQELKLRHSAIDQGSPPDIFDGNWETLMRGAEVNPLVVELELPSPRQVSTIGVDLATMPRFRIDIKLSGPAGPEQTISQEFSGLPPDPHVDLPLPDGGMQVSKLRLEIHDLAPSLRGVFIHLRELKLGA